MNERIANIVRYAGLALVAGGIAVGVSACPSQPFYDLAGGLWDRITSPGDTINTRRVSEVFGDNPSLAWTLREELERRPELADEISGYHNHVLDDMTDR